MEGLSRLIRPAASWARLALAGALAVSLVAGAVTWRFAHDWALDAAEAEGRVELSFFTEALQKDLARYKLLAKSLAETSVMRRRAVTDFGAADAETLMQRMAAVSGAARISFITRATARPGAEAEAIQAAYQGAMGLGFTPADGGAFLIAAPVRAAAPGLGAPGAPVAGALVIRVTSADLEWSWRALPGIVFFTGPDGVIRLTSLPTLRLLRLDPQGRAGAASAALALPPEQTPPLTMTERDGRAVWRFADPAWRALGVAPAEALAVRRPTPSLGMTAYELIDLAPARRTAWLAAAAIGASLFAVGVILAAALLRAAARAARLAAEARAKAELEMRVADRTAELTAEIAERRATEARLRATQDDLVQAGKLSALGRMAAGLAHEINQPLAAIRGFADNAVVFLDRGRAPEARENLTRISDLTERAARIIRHLRAFARNQPVSAAPTAMAEVVEGALALLAPELRAAGADLRWSPPGAPIHAVGGAVRLQQVVVNLITNALDAQKDVDPPVIELTLWAEKGRVRLTVRDRGPGLSAEAESRAFDPFYSTKDPGEAGSAGMGLGLSISYGIVRSFGGDLRAAAHPEGGAVFTIDLAAAEAAPGLAASDVPQGPEPEKAA